MVSLEFSSNIFNMSTVIKEGKEELNSALKMFISVRFSFSTNCSCKPIFLGLRDET